MNAASLMTSNHPLPRAPRSSCCPMGAKTAPAFGREAALGVSLMPLLEQDVPAIPQIIYALLDGIALLHWFEGCEAPRHPADSSCDAQGTLLPRSVYPSSAEFQIETCLSAQQWLQLFIYPGGPMLCFWWDERRKPSDAPGGLSGLRNVILFPGLGAALTALGEQAGMSGEEFVANLRRAGRLDAANDALLTAALTSSALANGLMTPASPTLSPFVC